MPICVPFPQHKSRKAPLDQAKGTCSPASCILQQPPDAYGIYKKLHKVSPWNICMLQKMLGCVLCRSINCYRGEAKMVGTAGATIHHVIGPTHLPLEPFSAVMSTCRHLLSQMVFPWLNQMVPFRRTCPLF